MDLDWGHGVRIMYSERTYVRATLQVFDEEAISS